MILNSTQISDRGKCDRMWYIRHVLRKAPFFPKEALEKGSLFHLAMEATNLGMRSQQVQNLLLDLKKAIAKGDDEKIEAIIAHFESVIPGVSIPRELSLSEEDCAFVLTRFVQRQAYYEGRDFEIVHSPTGEPAVEVGFTVEIGEFQTSDGPEKAILEGKYDLLVHLRAFNMIAYADYKTQSRTANLSHARGQFRNYDLALNLNSTKTGYGYIDYVGLQQKVDDKTFRRDLMTFTYESRQEWKEYLLTDVFPGMYEAKKSFENAKPCFTACAGPFDSNPCDYLSACSAGSNMVLEIVNQSMQTVPPYSSWKMKGK